MLLLIHHSNTPLLPVGFAQGLSLLNGNTPSRTRTRTSRRNDLTPFNALTPPTGNSLNFFDVRPSSYASSISRAKSLCSTLSRRRYDCLRYSRPWPGESKPRLFPAPAQLNVSRPSRFPPERRSFPHINFGLPNPPKLVAPASLPASN